MMHFFLFVYIFLWFFNSVQLKLGKRKPYWTLKLAVQYSILSILPTLFPVSYWPDDMVISVKGLLLAVHLGDVVLGVPGGFFISISVKNPCKHCPGYGPYYTRTKKALKNCFLSRHLHIKEKEFEVVFFTEK